MDKYFITAACLTFLVGLVHSLLGERLIFSRLRNRGLVPTEGGKILDERHIRILWASWHLVTIFGWGFAAILFRLSLPSPEYSLQLFVENSIIYSMLTASLIVLIATKAKHPAWLVLLAVAILVVSRVH